MESGAGAVRFCSAEKGGLFLADQPAIFNRGCVSAERVALTREWCVCDGNRERREGASCLQSCNNRAEQQQHRVTARALRSPSLTHTLT